MEVETAGRLEKWLATTRKPVSIVLNGGSVNGLSFVRSMGRRQVPTLVLDSLKNIGTYTRFGTNLTLPPVEEHPAAWLSLLEFVGSRLEQPGVIFFTSDPQLLFLSKNREPIGKFFRFLMPAAEIVERIVSKRGQYTTAQNAGIPIPLTIYPETIGDARSWSADIPYPCILKPYTFHGKKAMGQKKAMLIHSPEELVGKFAKLVDTGLEFMIQEIIPGEDADLFVYQSLRDFDGQELAWLTKQKLRQNSNFGDGTYVATAECREVVDLGRRLLTAYDNCPGFSDTEFKLDRRDQTWRLVEINGRTPLNNQLSISAGLDLPWIAYRYLTGKREQTPLRDAMTFRTGVAWINEQADIGSFYRLWKSGKIGVVSWLLSIVRARSKAVWAWDDPGPALVLAWHLGKACVQKAWRFSTGRISAMRLNPAHKLQANKK